MPSVPIVNSSDQLMLAKSPNEGVVLADRPDGVVVWEKVDFLSLAQQFHHSQIALLQSHDTQNRWMRRWVLLGILFMLVVVAGGLMLLYFSFFSSRQLEQNLSQKITASQSDLSQKFLQQLSVQDQKYWVELQKISTQDRQVYQHLSDMFLELQDKQQQMQKRYEDRVVALETDKLKWQQQSQELATLSTNKELELLKSKAAMQELQKKLAQLERQLAEQQQQVQFWKNKAMEKLSAQELETLHRDIHDDK